MFCDKHIHYDGHALKPDKWPCVHMYEMLADTFEHYQGYQIYLLTIKFVSINSGTHCGESEIPEGD